MLPAEKRGTTERTNAMNCPSASTSEKSWPVPKEVKTWLTLATAIPVLLLVIWLIYSFAQIPSGPPKIQLLKVGMTVKQAEKILGKPVKTWTVPGAPDSDCRQYKGNKDRTIIVTYKNGTVERFEETVTDSWPRLPIG
jgi:hypothetical protein